MATKEYDALLSQKSGEELRLLFPFTKLENVDGLAEGLDALRAAVNAAQKASYHKASGTDGTAGYVAFAQLVVTGTNADRPIVFEVRNRSMQASNIYVCFQDIDGTDPDLKYIQSDGEIQLWAYKVSTSTWEIIANKNGASDCFEVMHATTSDKINLTFINKHYDTLPTSDITSRDQLLGKVKKSVLDNMSNTITDHTSRIEALESGGSGGTSVVLSDSKPDSACLWARITKTK